MNTETLTTGLSSELKNQNLTAQIGNLFDSNGRLTPTPSDIVFSQKSRRYFKLTQPILNYSQIYSNIKTYMNIGTLTETEFKEKAEALLKEVQIDPVMCGLLNGVHMPFICPQTIPGGDLGMELDEVLLTAVGKSFSEKFPEYNFNNYYKGQLTGKMTVLPESRYEKLLEKRKSGPVVGWYFADCLQEYAIPSQRTVMSRIPERFILSGPLEVAAAQVGIPDLLIKKDNVYPPLLSLTAVKPEVENFFYFFEAYSWNLTFNRRSFTGAVSENFTGGLTLI